MQPYISCEDGNRGRNAHESDYLFHDLGPEHVVSVLSLFMLSRVLHWLMQSDYVGTYTLMILTSTPGLIVSSLISRIHLWDTRGTRIIIIM